MTRRRRKSELGGVDDEKKMVSKVMSAASRRKSEAGVKDLLEQRRLLQLGEAEAPNSELNPGADDDGAAEVAPVESNKAEDNLSASESDDSSDSEDEEGELSADETRALDAAVAAGLSAALASTDDQSSSSSASSNKMSPSLAVSALLPTVRRRKQRQALDSHADPSPYLATAGKGRLVTARTSALLGTAAKGKTKGSSLDLERLSSSSDVYGSGPRDAVEERLNGAKKAAAAVTSGKGWFDLPATELTDEVKQDLRAVRMRGALDPKRFYKSMDGRPSQFVQVGTVVEGRDEFWSGRLTKKERRTNLVEELMADEKSRRYTKRKFATIQSAKQNKRRFGEKAKTKLPKHNKK